MEATTFTTTVLTAGEGKSLTQSGEIDIMQRIIASRVALGRNDSPENWTEISQEQADEYRRQQDAAREEDRKREEEEHIPDEQK